MHDAFMPIGIRTTLTDSQVFQVTSHIVGLVVLRAEIPIHLLSKHRTYSLLTCTRILCRGSHCENCRVRWWSHEVLKRSVRLVDTIALLFCSLSHMGKFSCSLHGL